MVTFNEFMGLIPEDFEGLSFAERERIKAEGWRLYSEGATAEEKASGALKVIFAHYHRSRESAAVDGREHPRFDEYVCHWLSSDDTLVTGEPRKLLDSFFPAPARPRIEKGKSYYY